MIVSVFKLAGGNETILFVEDDDFLRPSVCNTLSRLGYPVIPVNNGIKALEIWQVRREDIQMLITDLVMPGGITGKQLASEAEFEIEGSVPQRLQRRNCLNRFPLERTGLTFSPSRSTRKNLPKRSVMSLINQANNSEFKNL